MAGVAGPRCAGLCIVRVWGREEGLVIRVRSVTDLDAPDSDRQALVAEIDAALGLVRAFLTDMAARAADGRALPSP